MPLSILTGFVFLKLTTCKLMDPSGVGEPIRKGSLAQAKQKVTVLFLAKVRACL